MPRLSEMPAPDPLTGLELLPVLQGAGIEGNRGLPLLAAGHLPRGAVLALRRPMVADLSGTGDADPGASKVRWNNADPDLASELYVSHEDGGEDDLEPMLAGLTVGGYLYLQRSEPEHRDNWQKWQVISVGAATGYARLGVTLQASDGQFADEDAIELTLQQPTPAPGLDRNVVTPVASVSGTLTCDASLGDYFTTTLVEPVSALSIINVPAACTLGLWITQVAAQHEFDFPASFNWGVGGSAPAVDDLGNGQELFVVITTRGAGATWDASARVRA